jgi:MoxR-like ATPase
MENIIHYGDKTSQEKLQLLIVNMEKVIKGKRAQIEQVITCLLAKGHILMEDNPGTGKTILARTLAACISGGQNESALFKRIQFTPDLLPMDLLGTHIYDDNKKEFIFKKGPLFCNVLLADEINRASPKVQSALLECMAENQITMGDITYILERLFFTIATQNPIEMEGTYPLPSAQLDRFYMKIYFGYVDEETEKNIYKNYLDINQQLHSLKQVLSINDILMLQQEAEKIYIHDEIINSVSNIVRATRDTASITLGASTRSGIMWLKCLKAYAMIKGRDFVIEDDVQNTCISVLHHRLQFKNKEAKENALHHILQEEMKRLFGLKLY